MDIVVSATGDVAGALASISVLSLVVTGGGFAKLNLKRKVFVKKDGPVRKQSHKS
jgi:hypothetical protein